MLRSLHLLLGLGLAPLHHPCKPRSLAALCDRLCFARPRGATATQLLPSLASTSRSRGRFRASRMSSCDSEPNPDADGGSAAAVAPPLAQKPKVKFCQACGGPTMQVIPDGEEKMRAVCTVCGKIHYENPKMGSWIYWERELVRLNGRGKHQYESEGSSPRRAWVVGCLVEHEGKVLLCKRKIEPSYGLWTLPAGYLEIGESAVEGAARETLEEACAEVEVLSPFAQLDIPRIGQSYIIFRAKLKTPHFLPGPESLECELFALDDIPFNSLAFSSIIVTLRMYIEDIKAGSLKFHYCTINKRPGASPSDPRGFDVDHLMHL